ncbi:MAG: OsmC family protein [Candidatus Cloacimonetes bacterium]|nr:OsmC family protein [Candidatus Cloacimonadota bacterium]
MKQKSIVTYIDKMAFDVELNDHHFTIDASEKVGGENRGPRPKGLLLSGLGGCTGMDVVSILKKMQVTDYKLTIEVEGEPEEEYPKPYKAISVTFLFTGKDLPSSKIKKAVELSEQRYCGVSDMLKKAAELTIKIKINGEEL